MEVSPRPQERGNPTLLPSPTTTTTTSHCSSSSNTNDGVRHHNLHPNSAPTTTTPNQPPPPVTRSESSTTPYPTTFVQADTSSFKQVVQMLTGSSDTVKSAASAAGNHPIPPIKTPGKQKPKLYERRSSLKNFRLSPLNNLASSGAGGRNSEILSPSILDFPSLVLSPVTPLIPDPFNRSPNIIVDKAAEERAIAEKGFFFHPSPVSTPRETEPRLLPLFPVTSPRVSGSN